MIGTPPRAASESGVAMVMVLALMALSIPLVTTALGLASTLSIDSRVKSHRVKSQYATMGGVEHAIYRLTYEDGYAESLPLGVPSNYVITLNGINVTVTLTKTNEPPPSDAVPPGVTNRSFSIAKFVTPSSVTADTQTTYTYTVLLSNMTEDQKTISNIRDDFPVGLTYVTGSTSNLTISDPDLVSGDLRWNLSGSEGVLEPFTTKTLQFQMQGSLPQGAHCNNTWVSPGGDKTRSGLTAKIVAGSPGSTLCPGTALALTKVVTPSVVPSDTLTTFTYTVTFISDGTDASDVSKIIDLMPIGFAYVVGSSQGLTTADPAIVLKNNGTQEQLTWSANPIVTISPGDVVTLTFQATGSLTDPKYFNEVTATISGLNYDLYTWPTAKVEAVGVLEMGATDGETTTASVTWLNADGAVLQSWGISVY